MNGLQLSRNIKIANDQTTSFASFVVRIFEYSRFDSYIISEGMSEDGTMTLSNHLYNGYQTDVLQPNYIVYLQNKMDIWYGYGILP